MSSQEKKTSKNIDGTQKVDAVEQVNNEEMDGVAGGSIGSEIRDGFNDFKKGLNIIKEDGLGKVIKDSVDTIGRYIKK